MADERHLCQFYHSEAEIIGDLDDVIDLSSKYLKHLSKHLLSTCKSEFSQLTDGDFSHITQLIENEIQKCTFNEACERLQDSKYYKITDGVTSINSEGEAELMRQFGGSVWLTHFEHMSVPFYQAYDPEDNTKALSADLLIGIGETIGAGQRHRTGKEVIEALDAHKVEHKEYEWYIDLKNHVDLQTAGFGMGIERFLLWLVKNDDIRDMQILPRFNGQPIVF